MARTVLGVVLIHKQKGVKVANLTHSIRAGDVTSSNPALKWPDIVAKILEATTSCDDNIKASTFAKNIKAST